MILFNHWMILIDDFELFDDFVKNHCRWSKKMATLSFDGNWMKLNSPSTECSLLHEGSIVRDHAKAKWTCAFGGDGNPIAPSPAIVLHPVAGYMVQVVGDSF